MFVILCVDLYKSNSLIRTNILMFRQFVKLTFYLTIKLFLFNLNVIIMKTNFSVLFFLFIIDWEINELAFRGKNLTLISCYKLLYL